MTEPLRLLLIEDSEDDALLILRALRQGGYHPVSERVETAEGLRVALAFQAWDVLIADYQLPHFSAPEALRLLQESGRDIPFIVASGIIGEHVAVDLMRAGANDYVMKSSLGRLPEAVRREIREAQIRIERKRANAALQSLIEGTAAFTGADFFAALARQIAISLDVRDVLVSEIAGDHLHTLAFWSKGQLQPPYSYPIAHAPCEITLRDGRYYCAEGLQQAFPNDPDLAELHAEAYLGVALYDAGGRTFGNICIIDTIRIRSPERSEALLRLFAARASAELERQQATRALEQVNQELEAIVAQRTTELRDANEQLACANLDLAQATRLKDEFLANMSHELRTPLNAILGLAESLQEGTYGSLDAHQQRAIGTIERSGRHLLALINDILDLSKIASGKLQLNPGPIEIHFLCENSLLFVKEQALRKQIYLTASIHPDLADREIAVDELRLRQALINLLANAVKFTPDGGTVQLTVEPALPPDRAAPEQICFHVIDTGIGIAQEAIDHLFQPFFQVNHHLNRQPGGTGLGLALVKQITELHGGTVRVESQPGEGSRFTIQVPIGGQTAGGTQPGAGPSTWPTPARVGAADPRSLRVLLAEDNEISSEMLSTFLTRQGFHVDWARNGAEAITMAHTNQPDLILMDVQMPVVDGLEAIQRIRVHPQMAATPIIAVTALAMPQDRQRCMAAGASAYLAKPIQLRQLMQLIRQLVAPPS